MFRSFNGFLALLAFLILLRWFMPEEAVRLAQDILIKVLTLIQALLAQVSL